jgi:hypothetical protein
MATLHAGVKWLTLAAALAALGCSTPDSSALFRPAEADSVLTETRVNEALPDDPPAVVAPGAGGDGSGKPPVVVSPVSTGAAPPVAEPPDAAPPVPSVPTADAGAATVDGGDEPVPPPVEPSPPVEPPPPVEPECGGALLDDICWYLGELDQTCGSVCAARGGVAPASAAWVGTPDQGGSIETCAAVLEALGESSAALAEGFREDGLGFGCHVFVDTDGVASTWWLTAPDFSPEVSDPSARLACGCAR